MALTIGSSWNDEPTPEEEYKRITGYDFVGGEYDLRREIERDLENPYIGISERSQLLDLRNKLNGNY